MPKITKSAIVQNLRLECDRHLYLSSHDWKDDNDLGKIKREDHPKPLKGRTGIQFLRTTGLDLERQKTELLSALFPKRYMDMVATAKLNKGAPDSDAVLRDVLTRGIVAPFFLLQAEFNTLPLRDAFATELGLNDVKGLPPLDISDLRPDVIRAVEPAPSHREVLPSGKTRPLVATSDRRTHLQIIDIKHAEHLHSSYAAELVFYASVFALWLRQAGLDDRYVVIDRPAIWTRRTAAQRLRANPAELQALTEHERLLLVESELEVVQFDQYAISVLHRLKTSLARVLSTSDWRTGLDWHVGSRCSMCDYLGYEPWVPQERKHEITKDHCYCAAKTGDHLSRIPTLTKGPRRTLEEGGIKTAVDLAAAAPDAPVFKEHNALRADAKLLPQRAQVLTTKTTEGTPKKIGGFPKFSHITICLSVNFDPAVDRLTALGMTAFRMEAIPYGEKVEQKKKKFFDPIAYVVQAPTQEDEAQAISVLFQHVAEVIDYSLKPENNTFPEYAEEHTTIQVFFWDRRQYDYFRQAVGRHLRASNRMSCTSPERCYSFQPHMNEYSHGETTTYR